MRLAREFGGKVHVVTIGDAGEILWNEREWRSLSEVARAITGTSPTVAASRSSRTMQRS